MPFTEKGDQHHFNGRTLTNDDLLYIRNDGFGKGLNAIQGYLYYVESALLSQFASMLSRITPLDKGVCPMHFSFNRTERLGEIGHNILRILNTNGKANQSFADAHSGAVLRRETAVRRSRRMQDQRIDISKGCRG